MKNESDHTSWDEFDWELEERKDDARVAAYVADLPEFIDLPDEDGVIMKRLQKHSELKPTGGSWSDIGPLPGRGNEDNDEDDDEDRSRENQPDWRMTEGGPVYTNSAILARDWSAFFASAGRPDLTEDSMKILCLYGKLMARSADLVDMAMDEADGEEPSPLPLKIAMCKRYLSDANAVMGKLMAFQSKMPESEGVVSAHLEALRGMHDYLTDLVFRFRSGMK